MLEDHAIFARDYLSPMETQYVEIGSQYAKGFKTLRGKLKELPPNLSAKSEVMMSFAREVHPLAHGYYQFEGHLQQLRILNQVNIELTPTYFNGTLGENQVYLRLLEYFVRGQEPVELPLVDLMDLWLEDQLGHATLLQNHLDPIEGPLHVRTREFMKIFQGHMVRNHHMRNYLRFIEPGFPAQKLFAREVAESIVALNSFVTKVWERFKKDEVLSRLTLRFIEHHFTETCYFLRKLAYFEPEIYQIPECPLTKPSNYDPPIE
ncbi:DUF2935 domain-containing protein [Bacillus tamaricis]|uniref:DUF2935 domain-containing protein n=1 Tax=Evansella tamaricis TaxID=2069301 RepID=A0ABS6JHH9_9BACI|nr:DUF2935 domain-containing protein [Evansella tamaricis]